MERFQHRRAPGRDDPRYSGRARYWFDAVTLSSAWFRDKLKVQRHNLVERYSPESHVELPIQQALQAVTCDPELLSTPAARVRQACEPLLQSLGALPAALEASVPLESWATLAAATIESISKALAEVEAKSLKRTAT